MECAGELSLGKRLAASNKSLDYNEGRRDPHVGWLGWAGLGRVASGRVGLVCLFVGWPP